VGTPASRINRLAKAFDPSISAAAREGSEERQARGAHRVAQPCGQRRLRPAHDQIGASETGGGEQLCGRVGSDGGCR
jgi:hypothetical protein